MATFNSLGSNYSKRFVWRSLFVGKTVNAFDQQQELISKKYTGQATLTYKGREALELALKNSGLPAGSAVGINGFTCYVVYLAVQNAGYEPVFIDIVAGQTNFGVNELKLAHVSHPNLKAIIVQNTLGYPADMPALEAYCQQSGLMIIEDLAHSIGTIYSDGREAGTVGQFTMLSFSQDKTIDVIAGGAMIDRRSNATKPEMILPSIGAKQRLKNRLYPFWTSTIRSTYSSGLGRILHFGLKQLHWLATPMNDDLKGLHAMSDAAASLLMDRWQTREAELAHRRRMTIIYEQQLPANVQFIHTSGTTPSYVRFPIWVQDRDSLVHFLRLSRIYIGDTWYDAPVGPKKYMTRTSYQTGNCPNAENLAQHIVNLPTHQNVTPQIAATICAKIKQWQASRPISG